MAKGPPAEIVDELLDVGLRAAGEGPSRSKARLLLSKAMHISDWLPGDEADPGLATTLAEEAVAVAEEMDDPDMLSAALDALGGANFMPLGLWREEEALFQRRLALVPRLSDPIEIGDTYAVGSWTALLLGRYPEAVQRAEACVEVTRGVEAGGYLHGLSWRALARVMAGQWDATLDDFAEIERLNAEDPRDLPVPYTFRAYSAAAWCRELRGDAAAVDEYLELHRRFRAVRKLAPLGGGNDFAARILARRGRGDEARAMLPLELPQIRSLHLQALTEVVAEQQDWDVADEIRTLVEEEIERSGIEAVRFFLDRFLGRHAAATGDRSAAITALRASAGGFAALGAPWEEAWSRLLLAESLASQDDPAAATEAAAALATFERLGSVKEIARARALVGGGRDG
jgi:tetratricopeptide (TPR) repeat protein